ncbi:anthranilate synthase component I [Paenibacillus psychroresistens]|uniref:Anthranilate synthase n=1 Tax=Paenibacillus psychroresistens TaxID=1778678 RepID=A0A6B8RT25_9BACL|nr:anthranilate synthase component I [Paenibacillus psychroresistens]QGQ99047.1 anthranilate synthase component I [Paenibacillus psychroresistens]
MSISSNLLLNPEKKVYLSSGNIEITRYLEPLLVETALNEILEAIDFSKGALFTSKYEYPGRYSRWDIGFINPPIEICSYGHKFTISALNDRGHILLAAIEEKLNSLKELKVSKVDGIIEGEIIAAAVIYEEDRTLQPSIFTLMRAIKELFYSTEDAQLGLYGAFAYDLIFQFEPMELNNARAENRPDLVLYIPDELVIIDHQKSIAYKLSYEFSYGQQTTEALPRTGKPTKRILQSNKDQIKPYKAGKYANLVKEAIKAFKVGDLFEVVPTQTLYESCTEQASEVFAKLMKINPSPYGFIINLGREYLVGSSPEMYVRVEGNRVETCPISGTIKRGASAIEDAEQIRTLLNSPKEEAELTMCTDVDRNDKSRICVPGTVKVIGRRQIELYSHLIHTVDHVEGRLSPQYDALDAFITHMWAVTVTGAPKRAAVRWIEQHEESPRSWYGGAVGYYAFNGNLNTGLTLRTIKIKDGIAEITAGATLLYDSVPEEEEQETLTKAAALVQAIRARADAMRDPAAKSKASNELGLGKSILLVDHEDSFVHTLANYFKQTGAEVRTLRSTAARELLRSDELFDLVVLSPGPGRPEEFNLNETIELCLKREVPVFGVCLGLQGLVEHFGGELGVLEYPQHGKAAIIEVLHASYLWEGMPNHFKVGRYHSLYASKVPDCQTITAVSQEDQVVMAVEHKTLPISAVQFHPESILALGNKAGMSIIENVIKAILGKKNHRIVDNRR